MIKRKSESNIRQLDCEILQGGYLFRFNELQNIRDTNDSDVVFYEYQELYFDEIPDIKYFEGKYVLNDNQIQFILTNTYKEDQINNDNVISLDELKQIKLNEFNPILNEFTLLISRAKLLYGENQELENVINLIKSTKDNTIALIQGFDNINDLANFKFLDTDINNLKNLLNPFLF
jgi:hypothetical protein